MPKLSDRALAGLAAALVLAGAARADEPGAGKTPAIEAAITDAQRAQAVPGLSAAVMAHGVLWTKGFGESDIENHVAAKPETLYRLASLSKPITAVAVMQLAERGQLSLDQDVRSYVPSFPKKQWPVTVRQLLAHLGGIRHYQGDEWGSTRRYVSVLEGLDVFKDDPLVHEPGTEYLYSTHGYSLLAAVVEAVSHQRFTDYLRENVFAPASMEKTRDDDGRAILEGRAQGYVRLPDGRVRNSEPADTSYKLGGGGLLGTAADLARFGAAFLDGRLVRPETRAAMLTKQKTRAGRALGYGLGWTLGDGEQPGEVWHTGAQQRVSTVLYLRPGPGTVVALLANLEDARALDLARRIADLAQP
jgi:CubicO group peptidase (beta-lactamase class C family)